MRTSTRFRLVLGVIGLALLAGACSSSPTSSASSGKTSQTLGPPAPSTSSTSTTATVVSTTQPVSSQSGTIAPIPTSWLSPAGVIGTEPTVVVPNASPPSQLESADLIKGSGPAVTSSDTVTVQYVGYSWTYKAPFDSSWSRGQPATFALSGVIKGWSLGLVGMQVGGRRELIIPPSLGYGASPPTSKIANNDTLIFIVDLEKIG